MRIAIDAMGGDFAPYEIVKGTVEAYKDIPEDVSLVLVGDQDAIRGELAKYNVSESSRLSIVHTTQVIEMCEAPAQAVRNKRDSSICRGMQLVKDGEADAFLSAGSTGAMVAAAIFIVRRCPGVRRPAIGTVLPTAGKPILVLDAGANTDCSEDELEQFAVMGNIYSQAILGQEKPVVGLLSIGGEELKGNDVTKRTLQRLRQNKLLNFRGNIEGHDVFEGKTDVCVCDGFVGNVLLKSVESSAKAIAHWMKREFMANPLRIFGALCLKGALKNLKRRMDPEVYGGAPLLGVNGTVIITHGASSHKAIYHAIHVSINAVKNRISEKITQNLAELAEQKAAESKEAESNV